MRERSGKLISRCTVEGRVSAVYADCDRPAWVIEQKRLTNHLTPQVHSVEQKSIGLILRMSRSGSDVLYSCHHNSSRFTFPIFAHS